MDISNLCRREIISVSADASVREAALAMRTHHVGSLVVTDPEDGGRAMGVITDAILLSTCSPPEHRWTVKPLEVYAAKS